MAKNANINLVPFGAISNGQHFRTFGGNGRSEECLKVTSSNGRKISNKVYCTFLNCEDVAPLDRFTDVKAFMRQQALEA